MKRILGLAALLGHALTASTGIQFYVGARGGGKRQPAGRNRYGYKPNPDQPRHWHNSQYPVQAERIAAAELKRQGRAARLLNWARQSQRWNAAHKMDFPVPGGHTVEMTVNNLNPFYVAK